MGRTRIATLLAAAALTAAVAGANEAPAEDELDVVELVPTDAPAWTVNNLFAPLTGLLLGGPGYWYDARVVEIETTPPGAALDLYYVRRGFQKRYEQADAPARVILPSRIEATSRDMLNIRALLDGHRQAEVQIPVRSRESRVMLDLFPLPNSLIAFSHTYFAGRGSLLFSTKEALTFRLGRGSNGTIRLILGETALSDAAAASMQGVESSLVRSVEGQQLGEDLVVNVSLSEIAAGDAFEPRSRQSVDPVRGLHLFALDLAPKDGSGEDIERARQALARIGPEAVDRCSLAFDESLREQLDPADLARALAENGTHTDKYLRSAMKRLGQVSPGGAIQMIDGSRFAASIPIELMAAATQPHQAIGYLSVIERFVAELEPERYRVQVLRGLIAPELPLARFGEIVRTAEGHRARCRGA